MEKVVNTHDPRVKMLLIYAIFFDTIKLMSLDPIPSEFLPSMKITPAAHSWTLHTEYILVCRSGSLNRV